MSYLKQVSEVDAVTAQEEVSLECKIQIYIIFALASTVLGPVIFAVLHSRKLKLYRVPIKLCKTEEAYIYSQLQVH